MGGAYFLPGKEESIMAINGISFVYSYEYKELLCYYQRCSCFVIPSYGNSERNTAVMI